MSTSLSKTIFKAADTEGKALNDKAQSMAETSLSSLESIKSVINSSRKTLSRMYSDPNLLEALASVGTRFAPESITSKSVSIPAGKIDAGPSI